jgi:hypothetical protein
MALRVSLVFSPPIGMLAALSTILMLR